MDARTRRSRPATPASEPSAACCAWWVRARPRATHHACRTRSLRTRAANVAYRAAGALRATALARAAVLVVARVASAATAPGPLRAARAACHHSGVLPQLRNRLWWWRRRRRPRGDFHGAGKSTRPLEYVLRFQNFELYTLQKNRLAGTGLKDGETDLHSPPYRILRVRLLPSICTGRWWRHSCR
jgi:hypothetical protein